MLFRSSTLVDEVLEDLINIRWGFQKAIEIQNGVSSVEEVMKEQAERSQNSGEGDGNEG